MIQKKHTQKVWTNALSAIEPDAELHGIVLPQSNISVARWVTQNSYRAKLVKASEIPCMTTEQANKHVHELNHVKKKARSSEVRLATSMTKAYDSLCNYCI